MTLPWSVTQLECLREMGFDVLALRTGQGAAAPSGKTSARPASDAGPSGAPPPALVRAARGVDLAPLLAAGLPRDVPARRALWRALRPLRKASRTS